MNNEFSVKEITDKSLWEQFQLSQDQPQFMQSWNAGELAGAMGEKYIRLGMFKDSVLVSTMSANLIRARRGAYLFVPYGPIQPRLSREILHAWVEHLVAYAKEQKLDFLRFCPFLPDTDENQQLFVQAGFIDSPIHTLAEYLWLLPLSGSEDDLLKGMSKTTRNLVRRAQRDGVRVTKSSDPSDVERFLQLHALTKDRHAFTPYPDKLFREQVRAFQSDNQVSVFCAYHGDTLIASAIVMYYGAMASYHHGASTPSKIPAAYLLQWEAIQEGKNRGCTVYNFWGISDLKNTKHPFYGISLFKTRYGGHALTLLKAQDYQITPKYRLTRAIETLRRIKRGFGWKRSNY